MAKTQYSFSHDAKLKGVATGVYFMLSSASSDQLLNERIFSGFTVPIRSVRLSAGAGFLVPILGVSRNVSHHWPEYLTDRDSDRTCKLCLDLAQDPASGRSGLTPRLGVSSDFSERARVIIQNDTYTHLDCMYWRIAKQ